MANPEQALAALNADIDQATNPTDIFALRGLLFDISIFAYPDREHAKALDDLMEAFDTGTADEYWAQAAEDTIKGIRDTYAADLNDPKEKGVAEVFFNQFMDHRGKGISQLNWGLGAAPVTGKTRAMRNELGDVMGFQQLDHFVSALDRAAMIGGEDGYQRKGFSYDPLKKELGEIREILSDAKEAQAGRDFAHIIPRDTMTKIRGKLQRVFSIMDTDEAIPKGFGGAFMKALTVQRSVAPRDGAAEQKEIEEIATVKFMERNVEDIISTLDRLEDEGSKLFGDSTQYKEMMKAASKVRELQKDMDYKDPDKIREMAKAMDKLHEKAVVYADKEAYKEKKTDRGISRKNGSLALLELSDFRKAKAIEKRGTEKEVKDMRHYDSVTGKVTKTAKSYGELVSEEIQHNRTYRNRKHTREMQAATEKLTKK